MPTIMTMTMTMTTTLTIVITMTMLLVVMMILMRMMMLLPMLLAIVIMMDGQIVLFQVLTLCLILPYQSKRLPYRSMGPLWVSLR